MNKLIFIVILLTMIMAQPIFTEEIDLKIAKLSLDKCLTLAEEASYSAILNKIDREGLDLDLIQDWFVYLPKVSYSVEYSHDYLHVGKEGEDQIPPQYQEDTLRIDKSSQHKLRFSQRLFDSSTITTIINTGNHDLRKDIIINYFRASIRFLVRDLYYDILIAEEEIEFYENLLNYYNKITSSDIGIEGLFSADNKIVKLNIERRILELRSDIIENKLTLLNTIRASLDKEVILTTELPEIVVNKGNDIKLAINNNRYLKNLHINNSMAQRDYAMAFLNFIPEFDVDFDAKFNDNLTLGVDLNIDGSNIRADIFGEYLVYDYENNYYLNRITDVENDDEFNDYNKDYDIKDLNFTLVGTIDLDEYAKNGVRIKELRNQTIKYNTYIEREKDSIILYLEKKLSTFDEIMKEMEILEEKINYTKLKKELLDNGGIQNTIEKVDYYENINSSMLSNVDSLFNEQRNLYTEFAYYFRKVDGY